MKKPRETTIHRLKAFPSAKAQHANIPKEITSIKTARFVSLFMGAFGISCLFFTKSIYRILPFALGISMCLLGCLEVWIGCRTKEFLEAETKLTSNGIVFALLGCVILCNYANADYIIGAVWGILSLIKGSEELNQVFYRLSHQKPFISKLIHSCIELLLGFVLLLDPVSTIEHHIFILGIEVTFISLQIMQEIRSIKSEPKV